MFSPNTFQHEELLGELGAIQSARMAERGGREARDLRELDDLVAAVRDNFGLFEELGGVSEALAQMPLADVGRDDTRTERTRTLVEFIESQVPGAPAADAHAIGVVLRHLVSHRSWFWLTREYGLDTDVAADTITWVISKLIDAANTGDVPSTTSHLPQRDSTQGGNNESKWRNRDDRRGDHDTADNRPG